MHFLFTAPRYHTNQHYPASALLEAGHEVTFLVLRSGQSETCRAVQPVVLGCSRTFDRIRRVASLMPGVRYSDVGGLPPVVRFLKAVWERRPPVVVIRDPRSAYGLLAMFAAKIVGARLILYSQSHSRAAIGVLCRLIGANWFTPIVTDRAGAVRTDNRLWHVPFVIPPQTSPVRKSWFAEDCINLLAIGKFVPRKNHCLLLDAVAELSRRHRIRATIIGECSTETHRRELDRVRKHCRHLGLDDRVHVELNLPFSDVQRRYPEHDVFVLASRDEPAAVSPLEAMAHSLPVVCSDSNGTSCYIRPGENGIVFRTDDMGDLVACLDSVVANRERLIEMGRRSYELVESEHAPSRYVEALVGMASPST